jgi:hypothetical protein
MIAGITKVRVMRKEINEQTGRETTRKAHEGVVMQVLGSFVRVFNPLPQNQGGDISPEVSEIFPVAAPRSWVEVVGEMKHPLLIPAALR